MSTDDATAKLRADAADLLEVTARLFEDGRFASAAAMLRGERAGRRPVDDARPLAYAERLLRTGVAGSANRAAEMAAAYFATESGFEATRDRLRKKLRTKLNNSEDMSGQST
ncbi:hypothetical protein [Roseitalea porphyridii]|uniref:Uncharacterized protein n=1 Tax=Roseitalea porphyridii TaxID=1852022 RepID=A0A4P6V0Z6_9HYPH|nr:hypothetical protein [Roseitalea porphyridii]QBK30775.1 hypothetical protein E0E05_09325 [Roseitalea porphyridii]